MVWLCLPEVAQGSGSLAGNTGASNSGTWPPEVVTRGPQLAACGPDLNILN